MTPKVSIICPTFNGASRGYLQEAIESVLDQSFTNYELFIIDDGSTDGTKKVCEQYLQDSRVNYIFQQNGGPARARNTGVKASSGEFICFLDDDDIWKPNKLQRQIDFIHDELSNVPNWGMVFTWVELIDSQGKILGYRGHHQKGSIYKKLLFENIIDATSSVLIRREVLENVGLLDESLESSEDWDMWLRISKEYLIFPVKEYLVQHREHKNRISFDNEKVFHYEKAVIAKALATAPADISPRAIYASCYMNRSISYFAADQYQQFREMLMKGAKLSLKPIRLEHILLFLLSLFGRRSVHLCRSAKRFVQQRMITHRYGDFGPYS